MAEAEQFGPVSVARVGRVAVVRMEDRDGRNTVSLRLWEGVREALDSASRDADTGAVVVTGTPEIFCGGASRQTLVGGEGGLAPELYEPFARALVRCPVPVVSAMQGHAIGGGLVFGLYADVAVLSERSLYFANFLRYGLAPYIGATHVLPARLGAALGVEMLLTARGYRGAELRERGAGVLVVAHDQVLPTAFAFAERIATAPRRSLELIKQQLAAATLAATDAAMARELGPHLAAREAAAARDFAEVHYGPPVPSTPGMGPRTLDSAGRSR